MAHFNASMSPMSRPRGVLKIDIKGDVLIEEGAFRNNQRLMEFTTDLDNHAYKAVDGVLYTADGQTLIAFPTVRKGEIFNIPDTVTRIADFAFSGSNISHINIPESVKEIGEGAFENSNITAIDFPPSISCIPRRVCKDCAMLALVTLPPETASIGDLAFAATALTQVDVPHSVTHIGKNAFFNRNNDNLDINLNGFTGSTTGIAQLSFQINNNK